ncbi:hypothetical protein QQS21_006824 [Conoideocrella luteorostrata]|uniref:Heterokaryon incompatibility domain-containing protein n=1 Tax=Conoideocrella luteorostrata TaxID=1105319 RepID=A0AAJ0FXN0_9HYPO|nr:hypothetical protein QQS21_006824 [Conoideocrella luteorostrata]
MGLCNRCKLLLTPSYYDSAWEEKLSNDNELDIVPLVISTEELALSAATCGLCELFLSGLLHSLENEELHGQNALSADSIQIKSKIESRKSSFPEKRSDGLALVGFNLTAVVSATDTPLKRTVRLHTENWSDDENVAFRIGGRPRLLGPGSDGAFVLLQKWLGVCRQDHALCDETISRRALQSSRPAGLPPRLLDVSHETVRLVENRGLKGHYVALSYCWGASSRPPLKTTRMNLQSHTKSIPWHDIPTTFQDTIRVARNLGIPYVWIDSLCIVQDDQQDWLSQSQLMGSIYQYADLTIAASHAEDSWTGFLRAQTPKHPMIDLSESLPEESRSSTQRPRLFASVRTESAHEVFPEFGALNKRAWATQEWLLSRRIVFYTAGQLLWSCKSITQRQTGERCYSISRNTRWKNVIEQYSDRTLTYPTDKLVALEGLRVQLQSIYGCGYLHGMWKDSMPDHLLWQVTRKIKEIGATDALKLPSWSWAHVSCGVRFLPIKGAKNLCDDIQFSFDERSMTIRSMTLPVSAVSESPVTALIGPAANSISTDIQATHSQMTESMAKFIIDGNGNAMGWMVFDEWDANAACAISGLSVLALMGGMSRRQEEKERRTGIVASSKLRHYWVLAIRETSNDEFERVGVGKLYGHTLWSNAKVQSARLI